MDFVEAIEFSKKFQACHPKVFKGFIEWGVWDFETDGYVVLTEAATVKKSNFAELENYVKSHNLKLGSFEDYFLISTSC